MEADLFGSPTPSPTLRGVISRDREDPLKVGGQLYLRAQLFATEDTKPADWALASPNLLDVFLDARPNDRVRAFVLGRMTHDPTREGAPDRFAALPPAVAEALGL
ncbi:MAG TPA: hypothetical protein VGB87_23900, partial [Vicinamibacteria bacterium]